MEENFEYPGSYNYGSDDRCFWAIPPAIPGLCATPANHEQFLVSEEQGASRTD